MAFFPFDSSEHLTPEMDEMGEIVYKDKKGNIVDINKKEETSENKEN